MPLPLTNTKPEPETYKLAITVEKKQVGEPHVAYTRFAATAQVTLNGTCVATAGRMNQKKITAVCLAAEAALMEAIK